MIILYIIKEAIKSLQLPSAALESEPCSSRGQLTLLSGNPALGVWTGI